MAESVERLLYRCACKNYLEPQGLCLKESSCVCGGKFYVGYTPHAIDIACTEDAKCPRMRRYDKLHKSKEDERSNRN